MKNQLQIIRASAPTVLHTRVGAGKDGTRQCWYPGGWVDGDEVLDPQGAITIPIQLLPALFLSMYPVSSVTSTKIAESHVQWVGMGRCPSRFMLTLTPKAGSGVRIGLYSQAQTPNQASTSRLDQYHLAWVWFW